MKTLNHAVAPGTRVNRFRQAKAFVTFATIYGCNCLSPTIKDLVMYIKFMANSYSSPSSIKNYLSGAKYWVTIHAGNIASFLSLEVTEMIKAVVSESNHIPSPAAPITVHHLKIICAFLDAHSSVIKSIKPCILITFACMLRASNVLSPSINSWAGAHTLLAGDIIFHQDYLDVIIRSTKTTSRKKPTLLRVLASPVISICPVRAWREYAVMINPCPSGPAFVLNSGLPLTPSPVVEAMRAALRAEGLNNTERISMHSLRRGAVQAAASEGVSHQEIMKHGVWKSSQGLSYYLDPASSEVPRAIAAKLAA